MLTTSAAQWSGPVWRPLILLSMVFSCLYWGILRNDCNMEIKIEAGSKESKKTEIKWKFLEPEPKTESRGKHEKKHNREVEEKQQNKKESNHQMLFRLWIIFCLVFEKCKISFWVKNTVGVEMCLGRSLENILLRGNENFKRTLWAIKCWAKIFNSQFMGRKFLFNQLSKKNVIIRQIIFQLFCAEKLQFNLLKFLI